MRERQRALGEARAIVDSPGVSIHREGPFYPAFIAVRSTPRLGGTTSRWAHWVFH